MFVAKIGGLTSSPMSNKAIESAADNLGTLPRFMFSFWTASSSIVDVELRVKQMDAIVHTKEFLNTVQAYLNFLFSGRKTR